MSVGAVVAALVLGGCLLMAQAVVFGVLRPWWVAGDLLLDALAVTCLLRIRAQALAGNP